MLSPSSSSKSRKRNSQLSSMRSLRSSTSGFVRIWEAIWGNPLLESLEISLDPKKQLPWNLHLRQSRFLEACFMFPVSEMVWKWEINPHILPHLSVIFIYKSCIYIHTNNVRLYIYIAYPLHPSYNDHYIAITSGNIQVYININCQSFRASQTTSGWTGFLDTAPVFFVVALAQIQKIMYISVKMLPSKKMSEEFMDDLGMFLHDPGS